MANVGRHVGFVGHMVSVVGRSQCPLGAGVTSVPMGTCSQWGRRHFFPPSEPYSYSTELAAWSSPYWLWPPWWHLHFTHQGRVGLHWGVRKSELGFSCSLLDFISVVAVAVGNYSLVFEGNSSAMNSSAKLHLPALVAQTHLGKEGFRRSPIGLYRPLLEKFISWVSSRRGPPKFAQDNAWQWGRQLGRLWVCSCHCQCARACVDCLLNGISQPK